MSHIFLSRNIKDGNGAPEADTTAPGSGDATSTHERPQPPENKPRDDSASAAAEAVSSRVGMLDPVDPGMAGTAHRAAVDLFGGQIKKEQAKNSETEAGAASPENRGGGGGGGAGNAIADVEEDDGANAAVHELPSAAGESTGGGGWSIGATAVDPHTNEASQYALSTYNTPLLGAA
jgi:hypothetical protein